MAAAGEVLRPVLPENIDVSGESSSELHVLAVDDSFVDRKVIERLLKISSCKVTAVESGTRALQYLGLDGEKSSVGFNVREGALKVNLIMTDYSMPGMNGYELLKKIKESTAFREVPVVIMSSENILTRIDRCLEEGAEEFIVKPVKLSDVKRLKNSVMKVECKEEKVITTCKRERGDDDNLPSTSPSLPPFLPSMSPISLNIVTSQEQPSSPSSPNCSIKRPRLQHTN